MTLTTERLAEFVGCQFEIFSPEGQFCGEIEAVAVEDSTVKVRFAWLAEKDGAPSRMSCNWTPVLNVDHEARLNEHRVLEYEDGRIYLEPLNAQGKTGIFFPKKLTSGENESAKLDPLQFKRRKLFVVTAHYSSGHGDCGKAFLITTNFTQALRAVTDEELEYIAKLRGIDHGFAIDLLEEDRAYARKLFSSHDHIPVPPDHPHVIFFRWYEDKLRAEWRPSVLRRLGITLPDHIVKNGKPIQEN